MIRPNSPTISVREAVKRLHEIGMQTTEMKLKAGIQQGVYPFGVCIMNGETRSFELYRKQLEAWIAERV